MNMKNQELLVRIAHDLHTANIELKYRTQMGSGLQDIWILMPRLNHRHVENRKKSYFKYLGSVLRYVYDSETQPGGSENLNITE